MHKKCQPSKKVTIYRSDYNGHKDSEGREYFDYILGMLNVPEDKQKNIDVIYLDISAYDIFHIPNGVN